MLSKPKVDNGVMGTVRGYTPNGPYKIVGVGATLSIGANVQIVKFLTISTGYNFSARQTKPLYTEGGNQPGPGIIKTISRSFILALKFLIHFGKK